MSADDKAKAEHSRHVKKISQREAAKSTAEMKDKLEERKAQRQMEAQLKNTKALGAMENEGDDDVLVRSSMQGPYTVLDVIHVSYFLL